MKRAQVHLPAVTHHQTPQNDEQTQPYDVRASPDPDLARFVRRVFVEFATSHLSSAKKPRCPKWRRRRWENTCLAARAFYARVWRKTKISARQQQVAAASRASGCDRRHVDRLASGCERHASIDWQRYKIITNNSEHNVQFTNETNFTTLRWPRGWILNDLNVLLITRSLSLVLPS